MNQRLFQAYVMVDWSAASKPTTGPDSIWVGVLKRNVRFQMAFEAHNPSTRVEAEKLLNSVGVWHFDQMASWKAKDIAFVDGKMEGFHGRITRDEWVKQAKILAKGGTVEDVERAIKGAGN